MLSAIDLRAPVDAAVARDAADALRHVPRDLLVRREPHIAVRRHVGDQFVEDEQARPVADDMRVHGQQEQAALGVGGVELAPEDVQHRCRRRVRPQRLEAVHVEVDGVVADPLHRQLDDAGGLAVLQQLVGVVVGAEQVGQLGRGRERRQRGHHRTGQPMPEALMDRIEAALPHALEQPDWASSVAFRYRRRSSGRGAGAAPGWASSIVTEW